MKIVELCVGFFIYKLLRIHDFVLILKTDQVSVKKVTCTYKRNG